MASSAPGTRDNPRIVIVHAEPWHVYERSVVYDRRSTPTLVFESESVIRRVRNFPDTWRELDDEALFHLSLSL